MSKAKEILNKINEANHKFKPGDFVYCTSGIGDPSYNCFAKIVNYIDGDKVELEVLCKRDGGSDIENILDEEGKKIVREHQLSLGKPILEKKIETAKIKLATLEKVQREI